MRSPSWSWTSVFRFVLVVLNHTKLHDRHDPIDESRSREGRLEPGEQSRGVLPFQNGPHQHLVGVTFDLLGRRMQPYRRAVTGAVGGRESGYQIALLGIAVLNGVVLVSYFNQLRARGMREDRIVVEGAKRRLRPVLMTASITALGLIPLLFASGPGSEIQKPLAIVVIGGLLSSTLLTLILLPILYRRFGGAAKGAA